MSKGEIKFRNRFLYEELGSILLIGISLPVLFNLKIDSASSFLSGWSGMPFNAALCLLFIGVAHISLSYNKYLIARALSVLVLVIGCLTFFEHLTNFNLFIDQLFRNTEGSEFIDFPGRMAANTSVGLVLVGIALLMSSKTGSRGRWLSTAGLIAGMSTAFGLVALFYNEINLGASIDNAPILKMSTASAFGFTIAGLQILLVTIRKMNIEYKEKFRVLPLIVTLILTCFVFFFWEFSLKQEAERINETVASKAAKIHDGLVEKFDQTSKAISRYASRLELVGIKNKNYLNRDSKMYVDQINIIKRIGITNSKMEVVWSYPENIQSQVRHFNQTKDPLRREAFEETMKTRKPTLSKIVELKSGGLGAVLPVAIYTDNRFIGAAYATIEISTLFEPYVQEDEFAVEITEGDRLIYSKNANNSALSNTVLNQNFDRGFAHWKISVLPTAWYVKKLRSETPHFILIFGEILSFLFGLLLLSYLKNQSDRRSLLESQERWRTAVLNSGEYSIIATDVNGTIQTFNKAAERMLGYSADELVGKMSPAILHDLSEVVERAAKLTVELKTPIEPGFEVFIAKVKRSNVPDVNEWTYIRKDGSRFPVRLSATALIDSNGAIFGYLGIAVDLTEQKKTQNDLQLAHDRLQRVIESSGQGIWERDFITKEILYIDSQCLKIFDFSPEEPISLAEVSKLIVGDDGKLVADILQDHIQQETPWFDLEFRMHGRKDPSLIKWIRARGRIESEDGKPKRVVSTVSDVTDLVKARKNLEYALVVAKEAAITKSAFFASMSHEIRTPLNGIIGMTDLLLETKLDSNQRNFAQIAQQSGSALLNLVNDILDFSKIESGKMEIENGQMTLASLVENQIDILTPRAIKKCLSIASFVSPDLPAIVVGDAGRLGQVLLNLVGNAIKFTASGGVTVNVTQASSKSGGGSVIRFEIQDSGIGVGKDTIKKLFKPFTQADSSIANKYGGTGLGLSISKKIIESMGGDIAVDSELGKGSTFWFEIPLIEIVAQNYGTNRVGWEKLIGTKVLSIESDSICQCALENYIESLKMRNENALSFSDAIAKLEAAVIENDPFQLVLISGKNGFQSKLDCLKSIQTALGPQAPKAIYISEFGNSDDEQLILDSGFKGLANKPIKQSPLLDTLVQVLVGRAPKASHLDESRKLKLKPIDRSHLKILVADDVAVNLLLTQTMLDHLGYNSVTVSNGLEVLDVLQRTKFDLILMDCKMPEMDGFEATRKIRQSQNPTNQNIPIVALTANAMEGDSKICLDAGMNDYLSKPMKKDQLEQMLDRWLGPASKNKSA